MNNVINTENPITLRRRSWKAIPYLIGSIVFACIGVWIAIGANADVGWVLFGLSGLCGVGASLMFLPNYSYVRLDATGLTLCYFFRRFSYHWSDIQEFGIMEIRRGALLMKVVGFNLASHVTTHQRMRQYAKKVSDYEYGISNYSHDLKPEELLDMLNRWKEHYMA